MRAALSAAAIAIVAVASGCGGGGGATTAHRATTPRPESAACPLSPAQKRQVAAAKREIARMHRLEAPLTTWTKNGTPALQQATYRFLLDLGRVHLPVDTRCLLIDRAKSAVGLCGVCFNSLEAQEPAVQTRTGQSPC